MSSPEQYEFRVSPDRRQFAIWEPGNEPWFAPEANMQGRWITSADMERLGWTRYVPLPTTDQTAARAAVLREAADHLDNSERLRDLTDDHMLDINAAANELRRMADETAATEHRPAVSRWRVETLDNLAGEWAPGTGWPVRDLAVERFEVLNAKAPKWKDGTAVTRRLVRETTTYTVEAEHGPAAQRQDGAQR